jgi:hypothetical protein
MLRRWLPIFTAASLVAVLVNGGCANRNQSAGPGQAAAPTPAAGPPPAAEREQVAGRDHDHDHGPGPSHAASAAAKKPGGPGVKAAKPAAEPNPLPGRKPPLPPPAPNRRQWDVPQAKSLAETPDVVLNSRVRAKLISKLASGASDIWPETSKGVVTLTGSVPTPQLRARAEQVARSTRGIRTVKNRLAIKPGGA